jgi:hypothetical protein
VRFAGTHDGDPAARPVQVATDHLPETADRAVAFVYTRLVGHDLTHAETRALVEAIRAIGRQQRVRSNVVRRVSGPMFLEPRRPVFVMAGLDPATPIGTISRLRAAWGARIKSAYDEKWDCWQSCAQP